MDTTGAAQCAARTADPVRPVHRTAVLAIVLSSYLMTVLDISLVITALPRIRHSLGFSAAGLSWVQSAYALAFGGLLLLGARAGDILGRRRMFRTGIALFTVASLAVGLAQFPAWLIAARAVQGVGAAIVAPTTLALLTATFPEGRERTRAVAWYGAVSGIGASVGLVLGGLITSWLSWRVGFFVNVPLGTLMLLAASRYLVETPTRTGRFDVAGTASAVLGMTTLVWGIVRSADAGWRDTLTVSLLAAGILLLMSFVVTETRAAQPIMPLRLFASTGRAGAYAARLLFFGGMMGFWFFITQFLQAVYGWTALHAGLAFLPMTLVNFVVALAVPRLTHRLGNARLLAVGLVVALIGMAWISRLSADGSYLTGIALPMVLLGIGQGAALSPMTAAGISGVAPEDAGAAGGLVNVAQQLGGSLGLGILVTVFATADAPALTGTQLLAHRIGTALTVGTGMIAASLVTALVLILRARTAVR